MLVSKLRLLILAAVLLLTLNPLAANANGGPLFYSAEGFGLLQLDENSEISLVREKVIFAVRDETEKYNRNTEVSVQYELHNKSDSTKNVQVLFLTPASEAFAVKDGDKQIAVVMDLKSKPVNWHAEKKNVVIDPISGKELRLSKYSILNPPVQGARFTLDFEPNETKNIVITYTENGGMYNKGVISEIYSHLYYLTPAAFWEGEPYVELEIHLDAPGARIHSNLPMEQISSKVFKAEFNELPSEDWYFSYTYPNRLLFPTNMEKDHNLLVLGTTAALTVIAAALALFYRKSRIFTFSMIGIFGFTVYYISKMGGYPLDFILVTFTDIMVGAALIVCDIIIRKNIRRRKEITKTV